MASPEKTLTELIAENEELRRRLEEAEETLNAIRNGEVDAVVVSGAEGEQVFTLKGADYSYRALVESMNEGAALLDEHGSILYCNKRLADMLQTPLDKMVTLPFERFLSVMDQGMFRRLLLEASRKGSKAELRLVTARGDPIPVSLSLTTIEMEKVRAVALVATDLTQRQLMEDIVASERLANAIFDQAAEVILVCDNSGIIIRANRAAHQLCEQNPLFQPFEAVFPLQLNAKAESDDREKQVSVAGLLSGQTMAGIECSLSCQDDSKLSFMMSGGPLKDEQGKIIGCVVTMVNITERKELEALRNNLQLKARLASHLAAVGLLASGVAHEINNPLTGVMGYAQLLQQEEDVPDHVKKDLRAINEGALRVANIVKKLLTFARQSKPERKLVDINEVITTTLDLRAHELKTSNTKVTLQLAPEVPMTLADRGQLQQVILNLMVNAETEMKLAHGKGHLNIKTERLDSNIRISIKDDGPGIAEENLERIFEPFYSTREVGEGTGLGLSLSHGIVAEHNGRLYAVSELGKGATFIVELPILDGTPTAGPVKPERKEAEKVRAARILVVDDEPVIRDLLSRVLTDEGHYVEAVDNAEDALEKIKNTRYGLIMLDVKMPDISGIELYQRLAEISPSLPKRILFVTGDVLGEDTAAFFARIGASHVMKPLDIRQLKREVDRMLAQGG